MPNLPSLSARKVIKVFQSFGWKKVRQSGSHIIMKHSMYTATLSVPNHKVVAKGTLRALIAAAGLTVEQFINAL